MHTCLGKVSSNVLIALNLFPASVQQLESIPHKDRSLSFLLSSYKSHIKRYCYSIQTLNEHPCKHHSSPISQYTKRQTVLPLHIFIKVSLLITTRIYTHAFSQWSKFYCDIIKYTHNFVSDLVAYFGRSLLHLPCPVQTN